MLVGKVTGAVCLHTPVAFLVAGVVALVSAFAYAEFSASYPESATEPDYVEHAVWTPGQRVTIETRSRAVHLGVQPMLKILIATDGSEHSLHAAEHAIRLAREASGSEAVLLNVEPSPVDWQTRHIEQDVIVAHLRQRGVETCEPARKLFEDARIPCRVVVQLGEPAETIVREALANGCDLIVMGTRGHGAIPGLALGSVALKVVHLSERPVTLVK